MDPNNPMKFKLEKLLLPFVFLLSLGFRLFYEYKIPFFSSDDAYFSLRHSEYIVSNFVPLVYDPLSYGGNVILNTNVFNYFIAVWDLFLSQGFAYKVIPAIFASSIIFIVYLLAKDITKNKKTALFAAILAAFIPIFIKNTLNQISILSLSVPLFFLLIYTFLDIKNRKGLFMFLSFVYIMIEPLNLLMLFTLVIFAIIMIAESMSLKTEIKEAIGMHMVLFVLVNLIFFKNIYLDIGLATVWGNFPIELYGSLFQNFNVFETVSIIGFIPLLLGVTGMILAPRRNTAINIVSAIILSSFTLLLLKLIAFEYGLIILAVVFCITSAISINWFIDYLNLTKISKYTSYIVWGLILISLVSLIVPSISNAEVVINEGVSQGEVDVLTWASIYAEEDSVILGNVYEGNLIAYIANRANVIDTQFFYAEDRLLDVEKIYTTESLINAGTVLNKYSVDYLYFSEKSKEMFDVEELVYINDETCFELMFENEEASIYKVLC